VGGDPFGGGRGYGGADVFNGNGVGGGGGGGNGNFEDQGIIPRALRFLFEKVYEMTGGEGPSTTSATSNKAHNPFEGGEVNEQQDESGGSSFYGNKRKNSGSSSKTSSASSTSSLSSSFQSSKTFPPKPKITIRAAYLEIYNEQVQDLLNPATSNTPNTSATSLPVRWSAERGFYVENLFVVDCENLEDCLAVLEEGLRNRTTGSHRLNENSSRSHSILTVYVDVKSWEPNVASGNGGGGRIVVKHGKISFVDLAGLCFFFFFFLNPISTCRDGWVTTRLWTILFLV
jgi:hypothetical protein